MTARFDDTFIAPTDTIVVTGAAGFIGQRLIWALQQQGFINVRCLVRRAGQVEHVARLLSGRGDVRVGNLLSRSDCDELTHGAKVILHLAAGRGEKSFASAYLNTVVTTRNLIESALTFSEIRRFVSVSSFSAYGATDIRRGRPLDEACALLDPPAARGEPYTFAKIGQDRLIMEYGRSHDLPYVIVRPGWVYGPGNLAITGRVGIKPLGVFLHLGGGNQVPMTYVDNCADAIALAGTIRDVHQEVFNVVDDDLPTSRYFLREYKRNVAAFRSVYVPPFVSYALCAAWEWYSRRSEGQLPPIYNRLLWHSAWKRTHYSNSHIKARLGWQPRVSTAEGLERYFTYCREAFTRA